MLDGDLDNIILMAMRKEPHRRYRHASLTWATTSADIWRACRSRLAGTQPSIVRRSNAKKSQTGAGRVLVAMMVGTGAVIGWNYFRSRARGES